MEFTDNISTILQIYHHRRREQPFAIECRSSHRLETIEVPYQRPVVVGEEWMPIDLHWLEGKASLIVIENLAGKGLQLHPTSEEKAKIVRQRLVVAYPDTPGFYVRPGCSQSFDPVDHASLRMRSELGQVRVRITAFPK